MSRKALRRKGTKHNKPCFKQKGICLFGFSCSPTGLHSMTYSFFQTPKVSPIGFPVLSRGTGSFVPSYPILSGSTV